MFRADPPYGILRLQPFRSRYIGDMRTIDVCLPPEYHENSWARYPVVYLLDGQNVFDPRTSFIPGKTWRADTTARDAITRRTIPPCILVGIWNAGSKRMDEYTGSADPKYGGGKSPAHDRYLIDELIPWMRREFRADQDWRKTALIGASLGGLYSLEFARRHPEIVGAVGALSPSLWWNERELLQSFRNSRLRRGCRVWLDVGTLEGDGTVRNVRTLSEVLIANGMREGSDLRTVVEHGAGHDENAWAARLRHCLEHLLPRSRSIRLPERG